MRKKEEGEKPCRDMMKVDNRGGLKVFFCYLPVGHKDKEHTDGERKWIEIQRGMRRMTHPKIQC